MVEHIFPLGVNIMNTFFSNPAICKSYRTRLLQTFSGNGTVHTFKKKTIIQYDGHELDYVYLIRSGCVKQYFLDEMGNIKTLLLLTAGDIFGEITVLQQDQDKVSTCAITDTTLEKITAATFFSLLGQSPAAYEAIMQMHSNKIRILMAQIQDAAFNSITEKLQNLLIRLAHQHGQPVEQGIKITYPFTHDELAAMISSTRSTVTKELNRLKKEQFITLDHHYIIVQNP